MSDFDSLREDFAAAFEAVEYQGEATTRAIESIFAEQRKLWADQAALRDEVNEQVAALANRVESLTRARLTEPAEVAESILSRSRWHDCSECGEAIRIASDGLVHDRDGLHTCKEVA